MKVLKWTVIIMGILIILGSTILIIKLSQRALKSPAPILIDLTLAKGYIVQDISYQEGKMICTTKKIVSDRQEPSYKIFIYDLVLNKQVQEININQQ